MHCVNVLRCASRGSNFIYAAVEDWMEELTCAGQAAIGFFLSPGFVVPVVLLML